MKKKTDNKKTRGGALVNKRGKQKSMCVDCDSRKSTFLKPVKPNEKINIVFTSYKTCICIVKTVKST